MPSAVEDAVLQQLASGRFEVYVPSYFEDFALGKAADLENFLAGSAEWYGQATSS